MTSDAFQRRYMAHYIYFSYALTQRTKTVFRVLVDVKLLISAIEGAGVCAVAEASILRRVMIDGLS